MGVFHDALVISSFPIHFIADDTYTSPNATAPSPPAGTLLIHVHGPTARPLRSPRTRTHPPPPQPPPPPRLLPPHPHPNRQILLPSTLQTAPPPSRALIRSRHQRPRHGLAHEAVARRVRARRRTRRGARQATVACRRVERLEPCHARPYRVV